MRRRSPLAVTNLTADGPTLTGAVVDGTGLVLTFGDPLNTASAPGSADAHGKGGRHGGNPGVERPGGEPAAR